MCTLPDRPCIQKDFKARIFSKSVLTCPPMILYPLASLNGLSGGKTTMRRKNEQLITSQLLRLAPHPQSGVAHHLGHLPSRPILVTGKSKKYKAGAYVQMVRLL